MLSALEAFNRLPPGLGMLLGVVVGEYVVIACLLLRWAWAGAGEALRAIRERARGRARRRWIEATCKHKGWSYDARCDAFLTAEGRLVDLRTVEV